jgi:hypothetical protein
MKPQTNRGSQLAGYEKKDVYAPGILLFLLVLAFGALIIHAGVWGWLKTLKGPPTVDVRSEHRSERPIQPRMAKDIPRLQVAPEKDWESYRAEEENRLNSYGWIDRTAGVVRIPISEAMKQIVEHGIPHWGPTNLVSPLELQKARAAETRRPG